MLHILSIYRILIARKKVLVWGVIIIVAVLLTLFFRSLTPNSAKSQANKLTASIDNRVEITGPRSVASVNKQFDFTLPNSRDKITYVIETAELRDEIVVKGQKATAVKGKVFLILNLKLQNKNNTVEQINTRDFVRLSVGENPETFAPDIHNDPVEIQPISTKLTRVGFPVSDSEKNFKLHIGEIKADKTVTPLKFN